MEINKPKVVINESERRKIRISYVPDPEGLHSSAPVKVWAEELKKRLHNNKLDSILERDDEKGMVIPKDAADLRECQDYIAVFTTEYGYDPPKYLDVISDFMQEPHLLHFKRFWLVQLSTDTVRFVDKYQFLFWHKLAGSAMYGRILRQDENKWQDDMDRVVNSIASHKSCDDSVPFCPRSTLGNTDNAALSNKPFYRRLIYRLRDCML